MDKMLAHMRMIEFAHRTSHDPYAGIFTYSRIVYTTAWQQSRSMQRRDVAPLSTLNVGGIRTQFRERELHPKNAQRAQKTFLTPIASDLDFAERSGCIFPTHDQCRQPHGLDRRPNVFVDAAGKSTRTCAYDMRLTIRLPHACPVV